MLCACVVKRDKISGSASSSSGAMTVVNQARQALSNPYVNHKGEEERVERVYIISPHPVLPIAMASVKGELEARSGQIVFCCGEMLLERFEVYAAAFIVAKSGLLAAYLSGLRKQFDEDKAFANIAFKHGVLPNAKRALSQAYVRPNLQLSRDAYSIAIPIPQASRFEKHVWWAEVKDADRDFRALAELLKTAAALNMIVHSDNLTQCVTRLHALGARMSDAWKKEYDLARRIQEQSGTAIVQSKVQIPLENPAVLDELHTIADLAKRFLDELRASLLRQNALTKDPQADPCKLLSREDSWILAASYDLARTLPKSIKTEHRRDIVIDSESLERIGHALLITGGAGYGKTTFCRWHAITDGEKFVRRETEILPVYIQLHQLAQGPLGTFQETFLPDPEFGAILAQHRPNDIRLKLYLDGLDEIPDVKRQQEILELVHSELKKNKHLAVVITAREHVGGPWLSWMPRVQLAELTPEQVGDLVTQLLGNDTSKVNGFFEQLAAVPALKSLTGVPLLTMLIVAAYQHMGSLPENRVELYRIFVDLMCGGWDMAKGIRRGGEFGPATKTSILMRLATTLHYNGSREAATQQVKRVVSDFAPGLADRWEAVLSELLQDGLLAQNGAAFLFRHLSFQEYLCAVDLADPTNTKKDQVLGWYLAGDEWWRGVINFYVGISKKPTELLRWLEAGGSKSKQKGASGVEERLILVRKSVAEVFPSCDIPNL